MTLKQSILSALLLLMAVGGRAQTEPTYTYDNISGWLKVTAGTFDLNTISPTPTVIQVSAGVTINNVPNNHTYIGVGNGGTLLNLQGGTLTSGQNISSAETFVLYGETNGGTYIIGDSGLGTLCFPNNVSLIDDDNHPTGVRAFKATGVSNEGILTLEEIIGEEIPAFTPVILYKNGGGSVALGPTGNVSHAPTTISQQRNLLVGINNTMTVQPESGFNHYLMQLHNGVVGFYPAVDGEGNQRSFQATQYRCFLNLPTSASARALSFTIPDERPDGINCPKVSTVMPDGIYDLNGRHVQNPRSGQIYIMRLNGITTKVIIKNP